MTVCVWVGGSIVTIVLAAKPLYCSLGLVCDPLVQKLVFRALLGLCVRVLRSLCFFGRNRPRAKEGVTSTSESNHHRPSPDPTPQPSVWHCIRREVRRLVRRNVDDAIAPAQALRSVRRPRQLVGALVHVVTPVCARTWRSWTFTHRGRSPQRQRADINCAILSYGISGDR